jgi:hypothetical protein
MNTVHPHGMTHQPPDCYCWHPPAAPVMSVTLATTKVFPPPPGFAPPPLYHDQHVFHIKTHRDAKFMQLYEVYARCNHSVAEGALFQAQHPEAGLFDTDECWGCADLFPNDCFHQLRVCPHREDPHVQARALPFLKELTKRQRRPCQSRQSWNIMTLDQRFFQVGRQRLQVGSRHSILLIYGRLVKYK